MSVSDLHRSVVSALESAGRASAYVADANEPDQRYRSYGVRAAGKKAVIHDHRKAIVALERPDRFALAHQLISSGYGEQQSVGLAILNTMPDWFTVERLEDLDGLMRYLHGWSKIDEFTGSIVRDVLFAHPEPMLELAHTWNRDQDLWLRRASVVLFTRKVAALGEFTDAGVRMCAHLVHDNEDLVLKGVGWSLKDMMRADKQRIVDYVVELRTRGVSSVVTLYAIRDIKGKERAKILMS